MSKKYRISQQAIEDLENIWFYTLKKWSRTQADRYYNLIIEEIEFVADNFMTGKSAEQTRKNYQVQILFLQLSGYESEISSNILPKNGK